MTPTISSETQNQYFYHGEDATLEQSKDLEMGSAEILAVESAVW